MNQGDQLRRLTVPSLAAFAITVRLVVVVSILVSLSDGPPPTGYVQRFAEIAATQDRLYREHAVEYPPVTVAAIELVGDEDVSSTATRLVWFAVAADAVVVVSLMLGWGAAAGTSYLVGSLPVLGAIYRTLDILPVALATAGIAFAWRRRERLAGVALAAAILAKVWPVALVPGLLAWGRRRALTWSAAALAVGIAAWLLWAGPGALGQVATQRHSPGWESESTIGALVWLAGDDEVRIVRDSPRIGVAPGWAKGLLTAATVVGVAVLWWRAGRPGRRVEVGEPALACTALLLFLSSIYSYPYVLWLLPWAAIALAERRVLLAAFAFAVVIVTAVLYALLADGVLRETVSIAYLILVLRNVLTGAIPVLYLLTAEGVIRRAAAPAPVAP